MKVFLQILGPALGILILTFLGWHILSAQSIAEPGDQLPDFKGEFLAISDADMIVPAYANGITNKVAGVEDSLIWVTTEDGRPRIRSRIHATNSVISWPAILEWHPAWRYAYVAETRGKIEVGAEQMKQVFDDFPEGRLLSVFDYSDPTAPVTVQEYPLGINLQNVSLNRSGDLLAAGTTAHGEEICVATLKEGLVDQVFTFTDSEVDRTDTRDGGVRTVEFHPTEDVIATNLNGKSVAFHRVIREDGGIKLKRTGKSVSVDKKLSVGNWHPSGKFFIVANVNWGAGFLGAAFNRRGHLVSVAYDPEGGHRILSRAKVGLSPEGFDISPDGRYAVAVNMRRTYAPENLNFMPATGSSSLSLVRIDGQTGELKVMGNQYGFAGALPEDAVFDHESNSIAVAVYHAKDAVFPNQGWIDFWEIENDHLVKTKTQLKVTRGVHNLLLLPRQ